MTLTSKEVYKRISIFFLGIDSPMTVLYLCKKSGWATHGLQRNRYFCNITMSNNVVILRRCAAFKWKMKVLKYKCFNLPRLDFSACYSSKKGECTCKKGSIYHYMQIMGLKYTGSNLCLIDTTVPCIPR